jgi:hypothetical protein
VEATTQNILQVAIQQGASVEALERIMAMQERHEANEARKAFHEAMAEFKKSPPRIGKDKAVSYGQTNYRHATLSNVTDNISAALSQHGLSAGWHTEQDGQKITVTCTITHRLGHSESTSLSGEPDASGQKNKIQQVGSTVTYLQRYTILALTGLATHDGDDDGRGSEASPQINEFEASELLRTVQELGVDEVAFCAFLRVTTLEDLTEATLPKAKNLLAQKRRALQKKGGAA